MGDGNAEGPQEDPTPSRVETENNSAYAETEKELSLGPEANKGQDKIRDAAISQEAHRDAADLVARNEAYIQHALETAQDNAKIKASGGRRFIPEKDESQVLRETLARERKAASSVTFGLIIASILVLIGLIAGGVYYFSSRNNGNNSASGGAVPGVVAEMSAPANHAAVSDPE